MFIYLKKKISFHLMLCLVVVFFGLNCPAYGALVNTFTDEVDFLVGLQVLSPERDLSKLVSSRDYVTSLENLINGRGADTLVDLTGQVLLPDLPISYQEALTIGGIFLGYSKDASYAYMKLLMNNLRKAEEDNLTGNEMAYIFYKILHTRRVGQMKTVLEERYLVGQNPKNLSQIVQFKDDQLYLADGTTLLVAQDMQAFLLTEGQLKPLELTRLASGFTELEVYFDDLGGIKTILVTEDSLVTRIRVLLSEELDKFGSSKSYDFSKIQIKATQPFKIVVGQAGGEKVELVAEKDEIITFTNQNGLVSLRSENGNVTRLLKGRVYLHSYHNHSISFEPMLTTSRRGSIPVYAGILEIFPSEQPGYLHLINELPLEMYLRRVVPGQIPHNWPEEAFKVQAIAARSYALHQIARGKFKDKTAHIDDSTASQIYNHSPENDLINQAIAETRGIVLLHDQKVIEAVYFSTSAGCTANNEEVWHNSRTGQFPGIAIPYLRATSQIPQRIIPDLTDEANALSFFRDSSISGYDHGSPYFRWQVELTRAELERTIDRNLLLREQSDQILGTDFIQVISGRIIDPTDQTFSIGRLDDINVVQRGEGGNIMIMDIVGSNGTYRVIKEYNIRFLLRPNQVATGAREPVILRTHDGKAIANYPILPSAFAAFDFLQNTQGGLSAVRIYGGGMGHGVGLSQWGMKGMALAGATYQEIIEHYYQGITLEKIY